jgi:hypothetical protein
VLNSICATHSPPLSPRPVAVSLSLTGHHSPVHPCGGTSILQALQAIHPPSPSVRTARLHQAPPGRGSPLPQSWRLTCLNYSQSVPSIVRCCTPHRSHPCAPRPSEQVSWMGLALNDSPSLAPPCTSQDLGCCEARKPLVGTGCFCARPKHRTTTLAMYFWMENEKLRLGRGAQVHASQHLGLGNRALLVGRGGAWD